MPNIIKCDLNFLWVFFGLMDLHLLPAQYSAFLVGVFLEVEHFSIWWESGSIFGNSFFIWIGAMHKLHSLTSMGDVAKCQRY